MAYEVPVEKLRNVCDAQGLHFLTTEQVQPFTGILGQERALRALRFGLSAQGEGFNIYVAGPPGTGRSTAVMAFVQELAKTKQVPPDWCYINNFRDPYHPKAISLPAGQARQFRADMEALVDEVRRRLPQLFEGEQYAERRDAITGAFEEQRQHILAQLSLSAQKAGFLIETSPTGLMLVPLVEGRPMSEQEFAALAEERRKEIITRRAALDAELNAAMKQVRVAEKKAKEQLRQVDQEIALVAIRPPLEELKDKYATSADVASYLEEVQRGILQDLASFLGEEKATAPAGTPQVSPFRRYAVNVVVDNSGLEGAPVLTELNPTYENLFGRIEREAEFGALTTDFTMLKGGVLHRANGGYLVLQVEHLLANAATWEGLKRALRSKQIVIEDATEGRGGIPVKSVRPEPIPLDIKVVLIGDPRSYYLLYERDVDFSELFKVKADFDVRMERSTENVQAFMGLIRALCDKEGLRHLRREAAAKMIEYGSRLAEDQERLSTHFARITDILREADFYARQEGVPYITDAHVMRAIDERIHRSDLLQQYLREEIAQGTLLIDTDGEAVGQVNGLSVISLGDYEFGSPRRITASIGMGRDGVIDIEHEAKLAGRLHTKGTLIMGGYLFDKYAQDKPLNLTAHIVFEQSYDEVEGDSASCAELYALLSALAELPVKQSLAVTGAVDQRGQMQAVGGVNEKIEGFFDACRIKGLTGKQGVIIPRGNVRHLMLKEEVVEAVRQGQFHVYAVETVDQGIELLTGVPAGTRGPDGAFAAGTVNARVDARLRKLAQDLHDFGEKGENEPNPESASPTPAES